MVNNTNFINFLIKNYENKSTPKEVYRNWVTGNYTDKVRWCVFRPFYTKCSYSDLVKRCAKQLDVLSSTNSDVKLIRDFSNAFTHLNEAYCTKIPKKCESIQKFVSKKFEAAIADFDKLKSQLDDIFKETYDINDIKNFIIELTKKNNPLLFKELANYLQKLNLKDEAGHFDISKIEKMQMIAHEVYHFSTCYVYVGGPTEALNQRKRDALSQAFFNVYLDLKVGNSKRGLINKKLFEVYLPGVSLKETKYAKDLIDCEQWSQLNYCTKVSPFCNFINFGFNYHSFPNPSTSPEHFKFFIEIVEYFGLEKFDPLFFQKLYDFSKYIKKVDLASTHYKNLKRIHAASKDYQALRDSAIHMIKVREDLDLEDISLGERLNNDQRKKLIKMMKASIINIKTDNTLYKERAKLGIAVNCDRNKITLILEAKNFSNEMVSFLKRYPCDRLFINHKLSDEELGKLKSWIEECGREFKKIYLFANDSFPQYSNPNISVCVVKEPLEFDKVNYKWKVQNSSISYKSELGITEIPLADEASVLTSSK